jgi:hypothetical protein
MIAIASRLYGNLKHGFGYLPCVLAIMCALMSAPALMAAEQEPLLEVEPAAGSAVDYDLTRLDSLPQVVITTSTIWTVGKIQFSGPTLKQVLADAGIRHGAIRLSALNDYVIDMTVEELGDAAPIVATRMNGHTFGVRDNGPLWLIYPFDQNEQFTNDQIFAKSIWQLVSIRVTEP